MTPEQRQAARARCEADCGDDDSPLECCVDFKRALDDLDAKDKRIADLEGECERLRGALTILHAEMLADPDTPYGWANRIADALEGGE